MQCGKRWWAYKFTSESKQTALWTGVGWQIGEVECVDLIKPFRLNGNKDILLKAKGWRNVEHLTKVNATIKGVSLAFHSVAVERKTFNKKRMAYWKIKFQACFHHHWKKNIPWRGKGAGEDCLSALNIPESSSFNLDERNREWVSFLSSWMFVFQVHWKGSWKFVSQLAILFLSKIFVYLATKWCAKNTPFLVAFISVKRTTFRWPFSFKRISLFPFTPKGAINLYIPPDWLSTWMTNSATIWKCGEQLYFPPAF